MILVIILLALGACKKDDTAKSKSKPGAADDTQPVMVETLSLRSLDEYVYLSGKLEGIVDITMNSETSGRILDVSKSLGDKVAKGERLGRVENDVIRMRLEQAEAGLLSAKTAYDNAQKNAEFAENSFKRKLISEMEYNSMQAALKGAKAAWDGAKAGVESARIAYENSYFAAPEAGVITHLYITKGQVIGMGQPVAGITDASRLLLKSGVGESQIGKLKAGQSVVISHSQWQDVSARVRSVGIRPAPGSATYPVEIELSNPGKLMPGMVVKAGILTNRYQNILYTAITNLVKQFDRNYVYIVSAEGKAERRNVELGMVIGENVVLRSGVEPGESIVISGSENLEDGVAVKIRQ